MVQFAIRIVYGCDLILILIIHLGFRAYGYINIAFLEHYKHMSFELLSCVT